MGIEKKKILVIDDSAMILSSVSHILGGKYKVYCATSGPKAMEIIEVNPPDLIFLDYAMPVRRQIVGGVNRTLISMSTPPRSCRIGTCRRLSAG